MLNYLLSTNQETVKTDSFTRMLYQLDDLPQLIRNKRDERTTATPVHIISFEDFCKQKKKQSKKESKKLGKLKITFFDKKDFDPANPPKFKFKSAFF